MKNLPPLLLRTSYVHLCSSTSKSGTPPPPPSLKHNGLASYCQDSKVRLTEKAAFRQTAPIGTEIHVATNPITTSCRAKLPHQCWESTSASCRYSGRTFEEGGGTQMGRSSGLCPGISCCVNSLSTNEVFRSVRCQSLNNQHDDAGLITGLSSECTFKDKCVRSSKLASVRVTTNKEVQGSLRSAASFAFL